jgi:hypothetical protein
MFWLDNLPNHKVEIPPKPTIREYKANYYVKNIKKYNQRNKIATLERSIERLEDRASERQLCYSIEKLSTPKIIHKMIFILNN